MITFFYSCLFSPEFIITSPAPVLFDYVLNSPHPKLRSVRYSIEFPFDLESPPFRGLSSLPPFWTGCPESATQLSSWNLTELTFQLDFILTPVTDWIQVFFSFFFFFVAQIPIMGVTKEI